MADDFTTHNDDLAEGEFDPNAITHDSEIVENAWLESNVSPKVDQWVGKTIGQFKIIHIIGTGGMGNVYEAMQMHPHRSVALKIVKSISATPIALQRFELESEMLARLQHPGIAQVYDSGHQMLGNTLLPFFAMEFVPGSRAITDYAEDEHLSREGRLELFLLVCNAVQYGHGRGVIHRDLKLVLMKSKRQSL
jgi:serine/threonine protein kinase